MTEGDAQDPLAPVDASPRFGTTLAVVAFVLAGVTLVGGLAAVTGPVGMAVGLTAHVKHSRLGLPAAFTAGAAMIVSMAFTLFMR
ncbi:MAG: hypothetical protein WD041_03775 [Nitriliruptoraceae bacterium]